MIKKPEPFIFVIFGGSGDLAERKLIPALYNLYENKLLPERFAIIGLGRKPFDDQTYRQKISSRIKSALSSKHASDIIDQFISHISYLSFNMNEAASYKALRIYINQVNKKLKIAENYLSYLATPPEFFKKVCSGLKEEGLNESGKKDWKRIIIEKPFGHDLQSARDLSSHLQDIFNERQIYRIDHYLGKESVQNILAFRFANGIFEPLWNRNYIKHVEITSAENIGVGDRGGYYDNAGALRDMLQNHLLQVASTIAMEPPATFDADSVRDEKYKFFRALRRIEPEMVNDQVIRGQYIASTVRGKQIIGYRDESNVSPDSHTETYVAIKFFVDNWRWGDVPFYVRTGKHLPTRVMEVVIHFRRTPYHLFKSHNTQNLSENQLILRIQPDEGILIKFGMKIPGAGFKIKNVGMDFHYSDLGNAVIPEAYERLILDALIGDSTLFARADSVEEAWKFVEPITEAWANDPSIKLYGYPAGTWGPKEAGQLFHDPDIDWRYPCKNLTGEETYCEL